MIKIHPVLEGKLGYFPQLVLASVSTTDLLPTKQLTQGLPGYVMFLAWYDRPRRPPTLRVQPGH